MVAGRVGGSRGVVEGWVGRSGWNGGGRGRKE